MLRDALENLRPAFNLASTVPAETAVVAKGGRVTSENRYMVVSIPQPDGLPDLVTAASDLDFAMARMSEFKKVSVASKFATITGEGRAQLRLLDPQEQPTAPQAELRQFSEKEKVDLLSALDDLLPFSEGDPARPWSRSMRFDGDTVTACNGTQMAQAYLEVDLGLHGFTLSREGVDYIRLRRRALKGWARVGRALLIEYEDESWSLMAPMGLEMPDQAVGLISRDAPQWVDLPSVDDEFRLAFKRAMEWAQNDREVEIHEDRVVVYRGASTYEERVRGPVGDEVPVLFAPAMIGPVVAKAETLDFSAFPSPGLFTTARGSRGLVAPMQRTNQ